MATLGLTISAVCGTLILGYVFFLLGRLYENEKQANVRAKKTRKKVEEASSKGWKEVKFDPLAFDDSFCCGVVPEREKCPVENCRITQEHSHTEAFIKRIKGE